MFQNKEKISCYQALMLVIASGIGSIYMIVAKPAVQVAEQDGWLAVMVSYMVATVFGLFVINLGQRFPDKTFVQYLPVILGKVLGKPAGLFYIFVWWITTPIIYRADMEVIRIFLPVTPPVILIILFAILVVYAMKKGFEVSARVTELFALFMVVIILFLIIFILPSCNFNNITPVLENGFMPLLKGVPVLLPFALESVLFMALWFPCMNQMKDGKKTFIGGMAISGICLTALVAVTIAFSGTSITMEQVFPTFYISRYIRIGNFLTGIEAVLMLLWVISTVLQLLVFSYPSVIGLAQWLNLKDYKPLIIPMTIISVTLSMIPSNVIENAQLDTLKNPYLILPLALLIPVTWLIALIRKLGNSKQKN